MICFVAQDGDLEHNAASDRKPMKITKEIDGVPLACDYVADDSSKLVLNALRKLINKSIEHLDKCVMPLLATSESFARNQYELIWCSIHTLMVP